MFNVGGLVQIMYVKQKLLKKEIEKTCNFGFYSKNILVTFHPVTLGEKIQKNFKEIILALEKLEETLIIFTFQMLIMIINY